LKDVAAAGGWKDVSTLLEVYQQSDEESVLAVTRRHAEAARERRGLIKGTEKLDRNSTTPVTKKKHHQLKC
jgi:hypothetical protein